MCVVSQELWDKALQIKAVATERLQAQANMTAEGGDLDMSISNTPYARSAARSQPGSAQGGAGSTPGGVDLSTSFLQGSPEQMYDGTAGPFSSPSIDMSLSSGGFSSPSQPQEFSRSPRLHIGDIASTGGGEFVGPGMDGRDDGGEDRDDDNDAEGEEGTDLLDISEFSTDQFHDAPSF